MDHAGQRLRDARTQLGLSLDEVAQTTRIPKASLVNLEEGRFDLLPADVFVRGFIRSYARAVGLDPNPLVRTYEARDVTSTPPSHEPAGRMSAAAARVGAVGRRLGYGPPDERFRDEEDEASVRGSRLDRDRKLVPLQPVSMRREGGLRGGFLLLSVAAAGLLVAAWILVGQKRTTSEGAAQVPAAPALHERIDGIPPIEAPRALPSQGDAGFFGAPAEGPRPGFAPDLERPTRLTDEVAPSAPRARANAGNPGPGNAGRRTDNR